MEWGSLEEVGLVINCNYMREGALCTENVGICRCLPEICPFQGEWVCERGLYAIRLLILDSGLI